MEELDRLVVTLLCLDNGFESDFNFVEDLFLFIRKDFSGPSDPPTFFSGVDGFITSFPAMTESPPTKDGNFFLPFVKYLCSVGTSVLCSVSCSWILTDSTLSWLNPFFFHLNNKKFSIF